jgi:prophage antirepressor-like protein
MTRGVGNHDSLGGKQQTTIINESGLYSLIFSSKLPSAKDSKRWVTKDVLPEIRKTGVYDPNNNNTNSIIDILSIRSIRSTSDISSASD